MSETLLPIVQTINSYLSDYILFFMLIAVGLCYSIKTRFIQVRCFGEGMRHVLDVYKRQGDIIFKEFLRGIFKICYVFSCKCGITLRFF